MIEVHHEPKDVILPHLVENCLFCGQPTRYWTMDKKTPVCPGCAPAHDESEIAERKAAARAASPRA